MRNHLLKYCKNASEREDFVGVYFSSDENNKGRPFIIFPYGYDYTSDDDVLCLIKILSDYHNEEKEFGVTLTPDKNDGFPIYSYIFIIQDYLKNGYYYEREIIYKKKTQGKINWGRTIKQENPIIQKHGPIYLTMQAKLHRYNDEYIMTQISHYCVYESFSKMGWFYGLTPPPKPKSPFNKRAFITTLENKLIKTNKDLDKQLFQCMLNVLNYIDEYNNSSYFCFGTKKFEKVWEYLIEKIFGTEKGDRKSRYFPKAKWHLVNQNKIGSNPLLPDTIMVNHENQNIYVIDAKYYRYGITKCDHHLPNMSSIAKQITYAQYIDAQIDNNKFPFCKVRNVFLLPFNSSENNCQPYFYAGYATAEWLANKYEYKNIHTILVDTKHLMKSSSDMNNKEIKKLSKFIEDYITSNCSAIT